MESQAQPSMLKRRVEPCSTVPGTATHVIRWSCCAFQLCGDFPFISPSRGCRSEPKQSVNAMGDVPLERHSSKSVFFFHTGARMTYTHSSVFFSMRRGCTRCFSINAGWGTANSDTSPALETVCQEHRHELGFPKSVWWERRGDGNGWGVQPTTPNVCDPAPSPYHSRHCSAASWGGVQLNLLRARTSLGHRTYPEGSKFSSGKNLPIHFCFLAMGTVLAPCAPVVY